MIAILKHGTTPEQTGHLVEWLKNMNLDVHISQGKEVTILGLVGDTSKIDPSRIEANRNVERVVHVAEPFKKANRMFHPDDTVLDIAGQFGYDNASKFAKAFRDVVGVSPRQYRAGERYDSCAPQKREQRTSPC